MKIRRVFANNRKKAFIVEAGSKRYEFPYNQLRAKPTRVDPVKVLELRRDLGNEAFFYELKSGKHDVVHIDHVLRYSGNPEFLREELLYTLTVKAQALLKNGDMTKRQLSRRLKTSPTHLYRLLDQTFYNKTIDQMVKLLNALGYSLELTFKKAA